MAKHGSLRLKALDEEDLSILSSLLQDALLAVGELTYLPKKRRFAATLSRFQWENEAEPGTGDIGRRLHSRVRTGVHFDGVLSVRSRNIRQDSPEGILELLALAFENGVDGAGTLDLVFAGGGTVQLTVECIDVTLKDLTVPWTTQNKPDHDIDDQ